MDKKKLLLLLVSISSGTAIASEQFVITIDKKDANMVFKDNLYERNMCIDILNRGDSIGNGVYMVDPDGGSRDIKPREAFCDMDNGGWTLYDSFGTNLVMTNQSNPASYNGKNINSYSSLISSGWSVYASTYNTTSYDYHVDARYLQFFYSRDPYGYIEKSIPSWAMAIKVGVSNEWYSGGTQVSYGSETETMGAYQSHTEYEFIGGNKVLRVEEHGITWVDAIWVK